VSFLRLFTPTLLVCRGRMFHGMRGVQQVDPTITKVNSHLRTSRQDTVCQYAVLRPIQVRAERGNIPD
jgi:hypothetical protein